MMRYERSSDRWFTTLCADRRTYPWYKNRNRYIRTINLCGVNVITDKAYETSNIFITNIESNGGVIMDSNHNILQNWDCDYYLYREIHLIENFFNRLKKYQWIVTRYDKLAYTTILRICLSYLNCYMLYSVF